MSFREYLDKAISGNKPICIHYIITGPNKGYHKLSNVKYSQNSWGFISAYSESKNEFITLLISGIDEIDNQPLHIFNASMLEEIKAAKGNYLEIVLLNNEFNKCTNTIFNLKCLDNENIEAFCLEDKCRQKYRIEKIFSVRLLTDVEINNVKLQIKSWKSEQRLQKQEESRRHRLARMKATALILLAISIVVLDILFGIAYLIYWLITNIHLI